MVLSVFLAVLQLAVAEISGRLAPNYRAHSAASVYLVSDSSPSNRSSIGARLTAEAIGDGPRVGIMEFSLACGFC